MVRTLLVYLCCGTPKFKHRPTDCIKIIHKRLQNGFHRFGEPERVRSNWSELFTLLGKHPEYVSFLDGEGEGDAPECYLIVVEKCLRRVASDNALAKYVMGKFAMLSYLEWIKTKYWYKREAYIASDSADETDSDTGKWGL